MSEKRHGAMNSPRQGEAREDGVTRRDFLRIGTAGLVGAGLAAGGFWGFRKLGRSPLSQGPVAFAAEQPAQGTEMIYRPLGRTGHNVSVWALGDMGGDGLEVFHYAVDRGVNYNDTADCYQGGMSEVYVGRRMKTRPGKMFLATKWHTDGEATSREMLIASAETSLKRLDVETIDLLQIHDSQREEQVTHEVVRETFLELKEAGKVRFMGFATHGLAGDAYGDHSSVIRAATKTGWYDCCMIAYNFVTPPAVEEAIAEATRAGIGVIAMKVVRPLLENHKMNSPEPEGMSMWHAAIKFVAKNPNICTMVISTQERAWLDHDLEALSRPLSEAEGKMLREYALALGPGACYICGGQHRVCPHTLAMS